MEKFKFASLVYRGLLNISADKIKETAPQGDENTINYIVQIMDKRGEEEAKIQVDIKKDGRIKIFSYLDNVSDFEEGKVLSLINQLNGKYRYVKLYLDIDKDLVAEYEGFLAENRNMQILQQQIDQILELVTTVILVYSGKIREALEEWKKECTVDDDRISLDQINFHPFG